MKKDFSVIQQYTRVVPTVKFGVLQHLLRYRERSTYETDAVFADSTFFDMFSYHCTHGSPARALTEPYSVVLLQSTAEKLFGAEDPVGRMISIDNAYGKHDFKVSGVVDESLGHTHIKADLFMAMNSGGLGSYVRGDDRWAGDNMIAAYGVRLAPGADPAALERQLPAFLDKYAGAQFKESGMKKVLHLQPVGTIHTTGGIEYEMEPTVSSNFLHILLLIAILIQAIACINFMNLSTARGSKRAKEVGVRKVIGAGKGDLVRQFLGESLLLSLTGVMLALPLLLLLLPFLNGITHTDISPALLTDYRVVIVLGALVLLTGVVAGSYPAFYLSAFQAIKVLKGNFTSHISATGIRRSLVVFQFVLSIVLITPTARIIVIHSQLQYIGNSDLGFNKEQKLVFSFYTDDTKAKMPGFMNDLQQLPGVKMVTRSNSYPSQFVMNDWGFYLPGSDVSHSTDVQFILADDSYVRTMGIKLLKGRDFQRDDSDKVLVNETLVKTMGLNPATVVGTRLVENPGHFLKIAGVIKDFNYFSLREKVKPFMLWYAPHGLTGWDISLLSISSSMPNSTNYKAPARTRSAASGKKTSRALHSTILSWTRKYKNNMNRRSPCRRSSIPSREWPS